MKALMRTQKFQQICFFGDIFREQAMEKLRQEKSDSTQSAFQKRETRMPSTKQNTNKWPFLKWPSLKRSFLLLPVLATLLLAGCNEHTDKLSDITGNPSAYAGKEVTVAGEVTQVYELPLGIASIAAYRISDGTGQTWVLSRAGAPLKGDKVGLKGTVHPEGRVGNEVLTNIIEEKQRKIE